MTRFTLIAVLGCTALALPASLSAHRQWMVPSTTTVAEADTYVTFDGASSNDLFFPDHQPLRVEPTVIAPDGTVSKVENFNIGKYRSTFDVHISKPGTWRVANVNNSFSGTYMLDGKEQRVGGRGAPAPTPASLVTAPAAAPGTPPQLPPGATDVKLAEIFNRNEVFVTSGSPTVPKPTGKGLELVPVTHPNDLVADEPATFAFTVDGKPAAGLKVQVIAGSAKFRDGLKDMTLTTDAAGKVTIKWPMAGMYWLNVTATGKSTALPNAEKRMSYTATLEVPAA